MAKTETTFDRVAVMFCRLFRVDLGVYPDPRAVRIVSDLSLDSLDIVELTMELEDEFGIEIPDDEVECFAGDDGVTSPKTVGDLIAFLDGKLVSA